MVEAFFDYGPQPVDDVFGFVVIDHVRAWVNIAQRTDDLAAAVRLHAAIDAETVPVVQPLGDRAGGRDIPTFRFSGDRLTYEYEDTIFGRSWGAVIWQGQRIALTDSAAPDLYEVAPYSEKLDVAIRQLAVLCRRYA